ncbi:unnamed protein product [Paramecium sonneborni]|uniref:Palmitoyltransferase n=1 Tax=Paramecium sonneborni TaxID=65129 RepID=A0A8S1NRR4_9CILI|nr:unnamed protein product [Paramecium sonneborni]
MIFWNRFMSWIPAIILLGIFIFIYSIYFVYNIRSNFNGLNLETVILHILILMFIISLFRAMVIEPGTIKQELIDQTWIQWEQYQQQEKEKEKERITECRQRRSQRSVKTFKTENDEDRSVVNMDADENLEDYFNMKKDDNKQGREKRFCKKCCIPKPLRTHHCSQCRCCWQRMDHHCQWINNCVAKDNYKIFISMIFYASCLLVWVSISQYRVFLNVIETDVSDFILFIIVLHYYFVLLIAVLITGFFIFHLYLISQNKTTLEQLEDKPDRQNYNQGVWQNFKTIMGPNILLWFLPVQ